MIRSEICKSLVTYCIEFTLMKSASGSFNREKISSVIQIYKATYSKYIEFNYSENCITKSDLLYKVMEQKSNKVKKSTTCLNFSVCATQFESQFQYPPPPFESLPLH